MLVGPGLVEELQLSCWVRVGPMRLGYVRAVVDAGLAESVENGWMMGLVLSMPLLLTVDVAHSMD